MAARIEDNRRVAGEGEQIVRRNIEIMNSSESVDEAMAAMESLIDPEIEWVNPDDAIERGTRSGLAGIRIVSRTTSAESEPERQPSSQSWRSGATASSSSAAWHARGESSGAEAVGPPVGTIYTIRNGRILRIEWHNSVAEARARFVQAGPEQSSLTWS